MKISDIMTRNVALITLDSTLKEAAQKMKEHDIGALPVTDGEKIKGMLTDRDIVTRGIAVDKDPATTRARDVMTEKISYVFEDDDISKAADAMKDRQIRRVVVLSRAKRLVGLVSLGDISRRLEDEGLFAGLARRLAEPAGAPAPH